MIKRFLFILVLVIFFTAIPCVANVANDENVMSKDVDISSKKVRKIPTAGLTKDMSVEKKKKKLAKFCVKYDNSTYTYKSCKYYREKFVDKIDWSKVDADLPIEFYELFAKGFHSLPPKYITDKTSLIKIQEFVEYMSDLEMRYLEMRYFQYAIETIIFGIAWEAVSDNGVFDTLKIFIKNKWINLIPDPKYYNDLDALKKIEFFIEKRGNTKYMTKKLAQYIVDESPLAEKYAYAWDNGYLDYTDSSDYPLTTVETYNENVLENYIIVIDKMKAQNYTSDEIKKAFYSSNLMDFAKSDFNNILCFMDKEYSKEWIGHFLDKEYSKDWIGHFCYIEEKSEFIDEMYKRGYTRRTILEFLYIDFKKNTNTAVTIIDTMLKNGYSIKKIEALIRTLDWDATNEIPEEFFIAVEKGLLINTLDKKSLEYLINADAHTVSILNNFTANGINFSELNDEAIQFIENKTNADELKTTYTKKDLDNDIVSAVLNSPNIKENKKVSSIKKLQAVRRHNKDHAENLRTAGITAVFSMYSGIIIAVTWPLCATFAITSAIIDKPRQLYYIPRYIQAKKLNLEIKKVKLRPLDL